MPFAPLVYGLCLLTCSLCAWLTGRGYRRSGGPLLFWSCCCFSFLALNNLVLILDLVILSDVDLQLPRLLLSLIAVSTLLYGMTWKLDGDE